MGSNVSVPYSGYIQGGINFGNDVLISGMPLQHCKRFSINLCSGPTSETDTALTFNPRFDDGKVVRNHKQGGSWGLEETNGGLPFNKGYNFEIRLKVEQQGYKVTVNNKHFCNFHHRIPKEKAQYLYIEGDVAITFIQFKGLAGITERRREQRGVCKSGKLFADAIGQYPTGNIAPPGNMAPPPYPGFPSYPVNQGAAYIPPAYIPPSYIPPVVSYPGYPAHQSGPLLNPSVPLVTPIPGGMNPGKIIYISGIPKQNPARFNVNLVCGASDTADIGLHFDVRFNFGSSKCVVVRTHRERNKYGPEERHQNYFPFYPGANFELMILAEANCYKIAVNNQHFTEFVHRLHPIQNVSYLNIVGDVQLTQVRFQ